MNLNEYCPNCRRRTENIKVAGTKLCKRCGKQTKRINAGGLINFKL